MFPLTLKSVRRSAIGLALAAVSVAMLAVAGPASAAGFVPTGHVDTVSGAVPFYPVGYAEYPGLNVSGWAADADTPKSPIYVQVNVTWKAGTVAVGQASQTQLASGDRSDLVGVVGPNDVQWGPYHGFNVFFAPPANANGGQACVTALNVGGGSNRSLGCYPLALGWLDS
jgi:hypothetical protein